MKKTFLLLTAAVAIAAINPAQAQTAATTTTEVQSPDGTTTTVIAPGAALPTAPKPNIDAGGGTTVVVDPPVAVDAITGKPVTAIEQEKEKKEEQSLRDRVRSKIKE